MPRCLSGIVITEEGGADLSLRTSLPGPAKSAIRAAAVHVGTLTAPLRVRPDFLVIGAQRCGTTSLFRALEQHRQVLRPTLNKGINYFDVNYAKGPRWYAGHFPTAQTARRRVGPDRPYVTFEASGYYMFHPLAPERIARDLPGVKVVAMLREPAERAYSAWKHESARGFESEPFVRALELEEERTRGERARMAAEPGYQSNSHRHHAYAARGDYVTLLQHYYDRFPSSHIHVVYSESFFADPVNEFRALTDFLGVDHAAGLSFDQHNARRGGPMPERATQLLNERWAGQVAELEALVGRRPPWSDSAPPLV